MNDEALTPLEALLEKEALETIHACLEKLKPRERLALELRFDRGMGYREMAFCIPRVGDPSRHVGEQTACQLCNQAMNNFRRLLEKECREAYCEPYCSSY